MEDNIPELSSIPESTLAWLTRHRVSESWHFSSRGLHLEGEGGANETQALSQARVLRWGKI